MTINISPSRVAGRDTASKQKTRKYYSFPTPTLGLVANGNIGVSRPATAVILDNWVVTAEGIRMRRGKNRHATLVNETIPVRSIFSYADGNNRSLFAANDEFIYDITNVQNPRGYTLVTENEDVIVTENDVALGESSTSNLEAYTNTSGDWIVIQTQASDGSTYLIGDNGSDFSFIYDGDEFNPQIEGGIYRLQFGSEVDAFAVGATLTGATSATTAIIERVESSGGAGTLWLSDITGSGFEAAETITDSLGGEATASGTAVVVGGTNVTFDGEPTLTTASMSYVWSYKNRIWHIEANSLNAWYGQVGSIGGEFEKFSLGGQFKLGGKLVMGATWSRDTGSGLAAMCAFFSSEGEVAIYQGSNPADANDWAIVGVYRIGRPLGKRALMDAGGDLIIATDIGMIPLSVSVNTDYSILSTVAVSEGIIDLWNEDVRKRPSGEWNAVLWSRRQMVAVSLPTENSQPDKWLVCNAKTKAWSTFSGWNATCMHVFGDQLYFGDSVGAIYRADETGLDDGQPYSATVLMSFDQIGEAGYKSTSMARAVFRSPNAVNEKVTARFDYDMSIPSQPPASPVSETGRWGTAIWGQFQWGSGDYERRNYERWRVVMGSGEVMSPMVQITSGSIVPVDAELIRVDVQFIGGEVVI